MLTRPEMEKVIRQNGSVLHGGRVISRVEDLPTAADLAEGDATKLKAELRRVEAQIAELQIAKGQLELAIRKSQAPPTEEAEAEKNPPAKGAAKR